MKSIVWFRIQWGSPFVTIWVFVILMSGTGGAQPSFATLAAPRIETVVLSQPGLDANRSDHECDILDVEDEREGDEDGGDSQSRLLHAMNARVVCAIPACTAIAEANLRVSGLAIGRRVAVLRC